MVVRTSLPGVHGAPQATPGARGAAGRAYRHQSPPAQRLCTVIASLPGDDHSTAALAAALATREAETSALLRSLADAGLVEQRATGRYAATTPAIAPAHTQARSVQRWYDWCLANTHAAAEALYPQALRLDTPAQRSGSAQVLVPTPSQAMTWFDAEVVTLAAAATAASGLGVPRFAWLLADALRSRCRHCPDEIDWLSVGICALDAAIRAGDTRAVAAAHLCLADARFQAGDLERAAEACTAAEHHAAKSGWLSARATALANRGGIMRREGRYGEALRDYTAALALFAAVGRTAHKATLFNSIGLVHLALGSMDQAAEFHRRALMLQRRAGSLTGEARTLRMLAAALACAGQIDAAERTLLRAISVYARLGDRAGESAARAAIDDLRGDADLAA